MELPMVKKTIYKEDSLGHTYTVGETGVHGDDSIVQHTTILTSLDKVLSGAKDFKPRKDDIWIVGFPKSGIHWISEVANALLGRDMTAPFVEAERILEMTSDISNLEQMESPRMLNTYMQLQYLPKHVLSNSRMIFVLRNPKSVAVSYFYHYKTFKHYEYDGTFSGFLPTFIEGLDTVYGTWFDMVTGYWKAYKDSPNALFVAYEDFIKNTTDGVKNIAEFLSLPQDLSVYEDVVEKTKFEVMKGREEPALVDNTLVKGTEGVYRKGITTDWKTHFSEQENKMFDSVYKEKMKDYPDLMERIKFT